MFYVKDIYAMFYDKIFSPCFSERYLRQVLQDIFAIFFSEDILPYAP